MPPRDRDPQRASGNAPDALPPSRSGGLTRPAGRWSPWVVAALALFGWSATLAEAAPTLSGVATTNLAGTNITVPFSFTGATNVVALQFDVVYDSTNLNSGTAFGGTAAGLHAVSSSVISNGVRRVLVYSLTNGFLQNGVIVNVPLGISALALQGVTGLTITNPVLSDINAQAVAPVTLVPGSIFISTALPARLGTVLRSPNGQVQFAVTGGNQQSYLIQASTNLVDWTSIATNAAAGGLINFLDNKSTNFPIRFYRAIVAP